MICPVVMSREQRKQFSSFLGDSRSAWEKGKPKKCLTREEKKSIINITNHTFWKRERWG